MRTFVPGIVGCIAGLLAWESGARAEPFVAVLEEHAQNRWHVKVNTEPGGAYRLQTSTELGNGWRWEGVEVVAGTPLTAFPVVIRDDEPRRFWRVVRLAKRIAFLGDSITDGISHPHWTVFRGYGGVAQTAMEHRFSLVRRSNAYGNDSDHGYGGYTAQHLTTGLNNIFPADDVGATDADLVFVNAGINDINGGATAQTTVSRVVDLHQKLRMLGKPTIGSTLMGFGPVYGDLKRETADEVNRTLPVALAAIGVPALEWHSAARRDANGFVEVGDLYDGIHPSAALGVKTGLLLAAFLDERVGQAPFVPPSIDSAQWLTGSPYVGGDLGGKDPAWIPEWGTVGNTYTKHADSQGTIWQECTSSTGGEGMHSILASSRLGASAPSRAGARVRGVARIQLPPGNTLKGVSLIAHCQSSGYEELLTRYAMLCTDGEVERSGGPVAAFSGLYLSEEFVIPPATHWLRLEIRWWGEGSLRFRQAGMFEVVDSN
jgi:hypothetical protein